MSVEKTISELTVGLGLFGINVGVLNKRAKKHVEWLHKKNLHDEILMAVAAFLRQQKKNSVVIPHTNDDGSCVWIELSLNVYDSPPNDDDDHKT